LNNTALKTFSEKIKQKSIELGFSFCGIAKADALTDEARNLEKWLRSAHHGEMQYMENYFDKRIDPRKLVDDAKSVISLSYNYFTAEKQQDNHAPKISKYAYGNDYHHVIKAKLKTLLQYIQTTVGEVHGRAFVDSAPVLERAWAVRSGLGWIGKNTMLIHKKHGSFYFLCELIIDAELWYDSPETLDYCGTCTRCIDACPTKAINPLGFVEAEKCISYATIELRQEIPDFFKGKMEHWMFGCDICNDVCPWNRFAEQHNEPLFQPNNFIVNATKKDWFEITEEIFNQISKKSPLQRAKYIGLKKNLNFLQKSCTH